MRSRQSHKAIAAAEDAPRFYKKENWAWKENPKGAFVNWHPNVSCQSFAGKSWPAAEYSVQIRADNGALTLSSPGIGSATILADIDRRPGEGRTYLTFQRSGDRWFLQEVTLDGTAHILPAGDLEKEPVKERLAVEARPSTEL